jgi:hypothetical protein
MVVAVKEDWKVISPSTSFRHGSGQTQQDMVVVERGSSPPVSIDQTINPVPSSFRAKSCSPKIIIWDRVVEASGAS